MNYQTKNKKKKDDIDVFFESLSKEELRQLLLKYGAFFDDWRLAEYLGLKVADIVSFKNGSDYGMKRIKREKLERVINFVMYVAPMNEPNDVVGYRVAFRMLNKCINMKKLCDYYGFDHKGYKDFMLGDDKAMTKHKMAMLYKALRLRPLNKFDYISETN